MKTFRCYFSIDSEPQKKHLAKLVRKGVRRTVVVVSIFLISQAIFSACGAIARNGGVLQSIRAISTDIWWLKWHAHARPRIVEGSAEVRPTRFHERWTKIASVKTLSLDESNHRVLYSSMSDVAGDGLGHALATFNTEVATALRLGLTYTHRRATFSSLTKDDKHAVEKFFGFGWGEISRENIQRSVCDMDPYFYDSGKKNTRVCQVCDKMRPRPHEGSLVDVKNIVQLPSVVSFHNTSGCYDDFVTCRNRVRDELLARYPRNTLFAMTLEGCASMGPNSLFGQTAGWFYDHYWRRPALEGRELSFDPGELTIAIHARRGDFLSPTNTKRTATPSDSFRKSVVEIIGIAKNVGGPFASLPVAVHVYSEGVFKKKSGVGHDISKMEKVFLDTAGRAETAAHWEGEIGRLVPAFGAAADAGLRVEMHIAEDTIRCLHEMVSADIFIGSMSGMSSHIVHSLSRGVVILPGVVESGADGYRSEGPRFGASHYDVGSGRIEYGKFARHWRAYAEDFERRRPTSTSARWHRFGVDW